MKVSVKTLYDTTLTTNPNWCCPAQGSQGRQEFLWRKSVDSFANSIANIYEPLKCHYAECLCTKKRGGAQANSLETKP